VPEKSDGFHQNYCTVISERKINQLLKTLGRKFEMLREILSVTAALKIHWDSGQPAVHFAGRRGEVAELEDTAEQA